MTTSSVSPSRRKELQRTIAAYSVADDGRAARQVGGTFLCYIAAFGLALGSARNGSTWGLAVAVTVAAAALVRLMFLQHELSHHSLFTCAKVNDRVALALSVLTWVPHLLWQHAHLSHHRHFGKLNGPQAGYLWTLSTEQYEDQSKRKQAFYRLYRSPLTLLLGGAFFYFVLLHRFVPKAERRNAKLCRSVRSLNLLLLLIYGALACACGMTIVLGLQLLTMYLAGTIVIWLFWVQHSHDEGYWSSSGDWNFYDACLRGSSCLRMPAWFEWWTVHATLHHAHHLAPNVPNYRLCALVEAVPELERVPSLTFRQSLTLVANALWDQTQQRMVPFSKQPERSLSATRAHPS